MSTMIRVVYHSQLVVPASYAGNDKILIEEIRERAAANNERVEISGVLLYNESSRELIQVLEGEEDQVRALLQKIRNDPRHDNVRVYVDKAAHERQYQKWGMLAGGAHDWKLVKLSLPPSVEGKTIGTFDEAFRAAEADGAKAQKKKGGFLARLVFCK